MRILNADNLYKLVEKINILLTLSAACLFIYLAANLGKPYYPPGLKNAALNLRQPELVLKDIAMPKGSAALDDDIFNKRSLFGTPAAGLTRGNAASAAAPSQTAGFLQEERPPILLGTSMGREKLAMIKDPQTNREYYCGEGDKVGKYTVKEIFKNEVILEADGKQLEISQ